MNLAINRTSTCRYTCTSRCTRYEYMKEIQLHETSANTRNKYNYIKQVQVPKQVHLQSLTCQTQNLQLFVALINQLINHLITHPKKEELTLLRNCSYYAAPIFLSFWFSLSQKLICRKLQSEPLLPPDKQQTDFAFFDPRQSCAERQHKQQLIWSLS